MSKTNTSKKVILVVDDNIAILNLYKRMFKIRGVDVTVARDGEEGLEMITREEPDFVILDIRMPKLDGIEVLKRMREKGKLKHIPVLIVTNYDLMEYVEQVKNLDIVDFLAKTEVGPIGIVKRVMNYFSDNTQPHPKGDSAT